MLTYGLSRHRPLLIASGFAALTTAVLRLCLYHAYGKSSELVAPRSDSMFLTGYVVCIIGYLLFLAGLILLIARAAAARGVLIASAFVWIPAQMLMVPPQQLWSGSLRALVIAYYVFNNSLFPILIITVLLLAGIGSKRRPKADPHDEHLFRERAAGGFSGFAFAVAIGTAVLLSVQYLYDRVRFHQLLRPSDAIEWLALTGAVIVLAAVGLGVGGWVLMLARRRFAGIALAGFAGLYFLQHVVEICQLVAVAERYSGFWDPATFWQNWPPIGPVPRAAELIEVAGIAVLGVVWGLRYFRAPPRLDSGRAFAPMIRPPPLPPPFPPPSQQ